RVPAAVPPPRVPLPYPSGRRRQPACAERAVRRRERAPPRHSPLSHPARTHPALARRLVPGFPDAAGEADGGWRAGTVWDGGQRAGGPGDGGSWEDSFQWSVSTVLAATPVDPQPCPRRERGDLRGHELVTVPSPLVEV